MRVSVKCLVLLGLTFAAGTGAAVEMNGVVETYDHEVWIDSVVVTYAGGEMETFATPGWGGTATTIDTFEFADQLSWPASVLILFRADGGLPLAQPIGFPMPGVWYRLLNDVGQVMFYGQSGVSDRPAPVGAGAFAVRPSVISGRAEFSLWPAGAGGTLEVYDAAGNLVRRFEVAAGTRTLQWDGSDAAGGLLAEGVYFCRLALGDELAIRKVLIAR